jgi:hypothetical protein
VRGFQKSHFISEIGEAVFGRWHIENQSFPVSHTKFKMAKFHAFEQKTQIQGGKMGDIFCKIFS